MEAVAHHYELFGGVSPINAQNRKLIEALKPIIEESGPQLPIYWGNRNWHPLLTDTVAQMANDGIKHALAFVTSAYSSYSGCRQYLDNIAQAQAAVGANAPKIDKIRVFYNHPGFVEANANNLRIAIHTLPKDKQSNVQIAFTAHSIPCSMAETCDYEKQLLEACRLVTEHTQIAQDRWRLVYQSRSGPASQPWLEPDICDYMRELSTKGVKDLVIAPIGFISDHMEVLYDLDTEAKNLASELELNMVRAATASTHPKFISMIRDLVDERMNPNVARKVTGNLAPGKDVCDINCCTAPK